MINAQQKKQRKFKPTPVFKFYMMQQNISKDKALYYTNLPKYNFFMMYALSNPPCVDETATQIFSPTHMCVYTK